jgi:NAD-dependent dihydropyrimidine dehydrogenase PreA subunit
MAEMMSDEEVYKKLREFLDRLPAGFPATDSGVEMRIIRKLFSPEEAEMAMQLTLEPVTPTMIAKRIGMPESESAERLESMARKGLIFRTRSGDEVRYQAIQFIIGIYEFQLNTIDKELAEMVEEYLPYLAMSWVNHETSQLRVVPVGSAVDVTHTVATHDRIRELVKHQEVIAVAPCICSKEQGLLGNQCDRPLERCLCFGDFAEFYIENGFGRKITTEETLKILDKSEESSCVLRPVNTQELAAVCSCCECCCPSIRLLTVFPNPAEFVKPTFQARIDPDLCGACGTCLERCQMDAIVENEVMKIDLARCIGCGLCLSTCPEEAVSLAQLPDVKIPPVDWDEVMARITEERGLA